jgi:hypothetical protein
MESARKTLPSTEGPALKRKKIPSRAPRRILRNKLRDIQRLIKKKNMNPAMGLPDEAIQEAKRKAEEIQAQLDNMKPEPSTVAANKDQKKTMALRYTGTKMLSVGGPRAFCIQQRRRLHSHQMYHLHFH